MLCCCLRFAGLKYRAQAALYTNATRIIRCKTGNGERIPFGVWQVFGKVKCIAAAIVQRIAR